VTDLAEVIEKMGANTRQQTAAQYREALKALRERARATQESIDCLLADLAELGESE
jgi:hypothetical protein